MGVSFLGAVSIDGHGTLSPRERSVLAALSLYRASVLTPSQLADALWSGEPPSTWPKQVQASVSRLRKVLGSGAIETTSAGYRLLLADEDLDTDRFEQLVARGRGLMAAGEPDRAVATFSRAFALWKGAPFGDLDEWPPAVSEAARLDELRRGAEEDLLEARLAAGEHREVAAMAEVLVRSEPLRERRWEILALAQYRCGRQADALRTLHAARRALVEQVGIDPGRELVELEARILTQDAALVVEGSLPPTIDGCPYKGLAAYDMSDRDGFFGRDAQIAACIEFLRTSRLLVVTGASGCGKSSLVRAGVAPLLARADRPVVAIVPGPEPLAALAAAMSPAGPDPAVVIDQFEELFAGGVPPEDARAFCAAVAGIAARGAPVLIAIRADHLTHLAADPSLGRQVARDLHFVTPLEGADLRMAIEEPARRGGLRLEPGLVDVIVRDVEGAAGALPLMSHALVETWRRRDGTVLTVEGYEMSGGIRGAVARSADRLYESLPPDQRSLVRSLMLRLVSASVDGEPVRRRVKRAALPGGAEREHVVDLLVRARLLTAQQDTVELAHEALVRAWPRMQSWLDEDGAGQRILRHLAAAAEGWEALGRPEAELYRAAHLDTALEYREANRPDLSTVETDFLAASSEHAESERAVLRAQARRDAQRTRRLRLSLAATAVVLAVALVAGAVAVVRGREADTQRDIARAAESDARVESLVNRSLALRSNRRDVAALLAVEAVRRWPDDPRARSALLGTFTDAAGFLGNVHLSQGGRVTGALLTEPETAVVSIDGGPLALLHIGSGQIEERFEPPADNAWSVLALGVSVDRSRVVELLAAPRGGCFQLNSLRRTDGVGCSAFSVYDASSGARIVGPVVVPFGLGHVALNDDGSLVAVTGGYVGDLALYRVEDGSLVGTVPGLPRPDGVEDVVDTAGVGFGPGGLVYVGSMAGPIREVDPNPVVVTRTFDAPPLSSHQHLNVGADGLIVGGGTAALVAVDTTTGATRAGPRRSGARTWTHARGSHRPTSPTASTAPITSASSTSAIVRPANAPACPETRNVPTSAHWTSRATERSSWRSATRPQWCRARRLDGGGRVTDKIAAGHIVHGGYAPGRGDLLLVAAATGPKNDDVGGFALWDPVLDRQVRELAVGAISVGWSGPASAIGRDASEDVAGRFDAATGARVEGADLPPECAHLWLTAGGLRAYCAFPSGEIWSIDVLTGRRVEPTFQVGGYPSSVSATRDGNIVIITAPSREGKLTTAHSGRTGARLGSDLTGPWITSVSLDGTLVAATGATITRYDLASMEPLAEMSGVPGEVASMQFSDDGATMIATSRDRTVSVFDVASGVRLGDPIQTGVSPDVSAFLRPDGKALAVTDSTGIAIWRLDAQALSSAACELAGRNLTPSEWRAYLGDLPYRATCPEFV